MTDNLRKICPYIILNSLTDHCLTVAEITKFARLHHDRKTYASQLKGKKFFLS